MSSSLLNRAKDSSHINLNKINQDLKNLKIGFTCKVAINEILNGIMLNERITVLIYNKSIYLIHFMGNNVVIKVINNKDVEFLVYDDALFSLNTKLLSSIVNKEYVKFVIKNGIIRLQFEHGSGNLIKESFVYSCSDDISDYVNFILEINSGSLKNCVVSSNDLRRIGKASSVIENNSMARDILLDKKYVYAAFPSFVFYKIGDFSLLNEDTLILTDSLLSTIRKHRVDDLKLYCSQDGKLSGFFTNAETYIIFKIYNLQGKSMVPLYQDLNIEWISEFTIGELNIFLDFLVDREESEVKIIPDMENLLVRVENCENGNRCVSSAKKVFNNTEITIPTIVRKFPPIKAVGKVSSIGRENLKAILLEGDVICLLK